MYSKDFSVIVPCWRGAIKFLPKLFDSIPDKEGIEIVVIDNSKDPVSRDEIKSDREIVFLHSAPERHAGGSRNVGLDVAKGKWLLFADSDDFFTSNAFDVFYSMINSEAEVIFTKPTGIYEDTGEYSSRAEKYSNMVHDYLETGLEDGLRYHFSPPWCKMIDHDLVERHKLRFDEIRAGNDSFFSLSIGYYASKISAADAITYVVTINKGSLTQYHDYEVAKARLYSKLHYNQFLRRHGLKKHQHSIMASLVECGKYGLSKLFKSICLVIKYKQNPFIGYRNWGKTMENVKSIGKRDLKYRVNK